MLIISSDNKPVPEMDKGIEISSIFTVIVDKKNRRMRYFLLAIFLSLVVSIGSFIMYVAYKNFLTCETLAEKNLCILQFLNGFSVINVYFFLLFVCDWKRFVEFKEIWSQTGLQNDPETINNIKSQLRKYRRFICVINGVFTVPATLSIYQSDLSFKPKDAYEFILISCLSLIYSALIGLVTDFPIQLALFICSVFTRVNQRLAYLIEHPDSTEDNMRSIRLLHSIGSQLTLKADQFIRYFLATSFSLYVLFILINLYRIIYLSYTLTDYFISMSILIAVMSMTAFITYNAVKINYLASKGFHHTYQLSFTKNSSNHIAEASLLMYRMGRNDIGLTFANLFTITASFVTSLATLCITFILAFPTIQSQSNK
uniref:Gustatory receptor n=1 Tax=Tetranychus urticae TaxID=32264 RepID=T1KI59_TETUR